ncbi:MAG: Dps family protein [Culicoidibacterales bacterium]
MEVRQLENTKLSLVAEMNNFLSNLNVMYVKLHNLHWNVTGAGFFEVHVKLEELYTDMTLDLDEVAERILTIGHKPYATMKDYIQFASIIEITSSDIKTQEAMKVATEDYIVLVRQAQEVGRLAEEAKDFRTQDLMNTLIAKYEKTLWMLQAYSA